MFKVIWVISFAVNSIAQQRSLSEFINAPGQSLPGGTKCQSICPEGSRCVVEKLICHRPEVCSRNIVEYCDPINGAKPAERKPTVIWNIVRSRCEPGICPAGYECRYATDYCLGRACTLAMSAHCILFGIKLNPEQKMSVSDLPRTSQLPTPSPDASFFRSIAEELLKQGLPPPELPRMPNESTEKVRKYSTLCNELSCARGTVCIYPINCVSTPNTSCPAVLPKPICASASDPEVKQMLDKAGRRIKPNSTQ